MSQAQVDRVLEILKRMGLNVQAITKDTPMKEIAKRALNRGGGK